MDPIRSLVVEDNAQMGMFLADFLKRRGHEVRMVGSAETALAAFRALPFDLVLSDWMLGGMTGTQLCANIRELSSGDDCYMLLVTGYLELPYLEEALAAGVNDYLTKPIRVNDLEFRIRVVERWIEERNRRREAEVACREKTTSLEALVEERSRQLLDAAHVVEIGTMAAGVAHELQNPLTVLVGDHKALTRMASLCGDAAEADGELKKALAMLPNICEGIGKAVDRMRTIVRSLLKGGRLAHLEPVPARFELTACLDEVEQMVRMRCKGADRKDIRLVMPPRDAPVYAFGDPQHFYQILVNLCLNAVDAIEGEGEIRIAVKGDDRLAVCRVSDTGPGIPPDAADRLFEPFYTTKPAGVGTGLGLPLCRWLAEANRGELTVQSEEGQGASFLLSLPGSKKAWDDCAAADTASSGNSSRRHTDVMNLHHLEKAWNQRA